ncbi:MAG TPA: MBL fold metallo-hydrolase [Anaerolineae bacterium]|nr:MBL fold metallo-hydrolase [Anaerolineae bacterium]
MPFTIRVLDMEQGDCTLIRCPNDELVMVDCGSKSGFTDDRRITVQMAVREWTKKNLNAIDALILTHPDRDHYSEVGNILGEYTWLSDVKVGAKTIKAQKFKAVDVLQIYFSNASAVAGPLGNYKTNSVGGVVYGHYLSTDEIHEVTIHAAAGPNQYITWEKADGFTTPVRTTAINNNRLTVLSGKTSGTNWSVSIIAGNVPDGMALSSESKRNTASLITLLEIGAKKGLICGDGTETTEAFLTANHAANISNLDFIQVGHHGSATSSGVAFANMTDPKAAFVSVANREHSHYLPKEEIIKRWLGKLNNKSKMDAHTIDYWVRDPTYNPGQDNKAKKLLQKWEGDGEAFVREGNLYFLDTDYSVFANDYFALDTKTGFRLYRQETSLSLRQTATNGPFDFTLG